MNEQIDQLILQKSNRIGLEKLPKVEKKITDIKVVQYEVYFKNYSIKLGRKSKEKIGTYKT